jgi:hypothetical protein
MGGGGGVKESNLGTMAFRSMDRVVDLAVFFVGVITILSTKT